MQDPAPVSRVSTRPAGPNFKWTVKKGETLYRIGRKSGTTPRMIAAMNGIEVDAPIVPGQVLIVPGHRPVNVKPLVVASKSTYPDAATPLQENVARVRIATPKDPVARKRPPGKTQNSQEDRSKAETAKPLSEEPKARRRPSSISPIPMTAQPRPVDPSEARALPRTNRALRNESPVVNQFPR